MAKIAIVSDVHLGTRQYGLRERYEDFLKAFEEFGKSIPIGVDVVVIGGDLFDSPRPDAKSVLIAQQVVGEIQGRGIHVYGIDGNHDLSDGGWLSVIGANVLDDTPVLRDGVSIAGINYLSGRDLVDKLQKMVDYGIKTDVLVMHFALAEMNGGGSADTGVQELSPLLDKLGVKAVLMGHVHIPDVRTWNGVLYVNPGSTEMKSYNEPRDKFFMVVDTDNLKPEAVEKVLIPTRKVVDVELNSEDDVIAFKARLQDDEKNGVSRFTNGPLYNVIADAELEDVFKRVSQFVKETNALCRIVVCAKRDRDVAPVIDRKESVATLESAIEARFPIESQEARLISDMLRSPEPSAIHARVEKFMQED